MRLAIVRQRYTPFGGAERFVERAIDALQARGTSITVYTRSWPASANERIKPVICDPFSCTSRSASVHSRVATSASTAAMCFAPATACIGRGSTSAFASAVHVRVLPSRPTRITAT